MTSRSEMLVHDETSMTPSELHQATGASMRQIDYWARSGCLGDEYQQVGSGNHRRYSEQLVAPLSLVVSIGQHVLVTCDLIQMIVDEYATGSHELAPGVTLTWPVVEVAPGE